MADFAKKVAATLENNDIIRARIASEFITRQVHPAYDDLIRAIIQLVVPEAIKAMSDPSKEMIAAVREIAGPQTAAYAIAIWPTMIAAALRGGE